ncbi:IPT/TIG domain-containing protein [Limibacterium fermenti]|uniref:IPT/TIG domain-containing protein n=1 Tax=Limibacterium fermenti TaxID=3229863 RepID=UPI003A671113
MRKKNWKCLFFSIFFLLAFISCSEKNSKNEEPEIPYDPNKPVEFTSFIPETGGMASQVIIKGSNLGTDADQLRVYFNKKKAKVVKTNGNLAYVLTPKLPGDTCEISIAVGKDSIVSDKRFYYKTMVQVYTIAGTREEQKTVDGTLAEARFDRPFYLAVDKEKNIFVGEWPCRARMVNEEKNLVMTLYQSTASGEMMSGCTDNKNETFYFPMNGAPYYFEFNPEQQWIARRINPSIRQGDDFKLDGKYSFAMSELDSMLYTITTNGELVKINPKTHVASLVKKGILKEFIQTKLQVYLAFHPIDKDMLYFVNPSSMNPADGPIVGTDRIYRMNMRTLNYEVYAGSGIKGHQDGLKETAEFNNPCQICFDKDGNMYVGDTDNFCVRRISTEGVVSTICGIPGVSGYVDGDPDVALFNRFWGMKIDEEGKLYITDYYNQCIRKLSIQ